MAQGGYLGLPWGGINRLVGAIHPGFFVLVGARSKSGKSTFLREVFNSWVSDFNKRVLYVGTEQDAAILALLWAALRCRAPLTAVMEADHPLDMDLLRDVEIEQEKIADRAMIVAEPDLSLDGLLRWGRYAWSAGFDVLMLNHFHRLDPGPGDVWQGRAAAARQIKNMATAGQMIVVAAAQLRDAESGMLGHYEVPGSSSWAEYCATTGSG